VSNVLIIGASKGIGLAATQAALANGHRVRAMARSATRIRLTHENLEKRCGNALEVEDVSSALDGIDTVVQALGIAAGPEMFLGPVRLFSNATRILIPAMQNKGVRRLICVTGFGAGDSRQSIGCLQRIPFRIFLGRAYDDKDVQERLVRESDLDWVIVRPGVLTNGRGTGCYRVLENPKSWRNGLISRADVADFIVRQIDDDAYVGKAPVLIY
jgi:putative NADH-flavin reductase